MGTHGSWLGRKGAFILTADGTRGRWDIHGPHFAGWEVYHLKGSPADPNRLYALQSSGWFGQLIQRYPVLRRTIRDHVTHRRRPFVRFFACEQDLSHEPPDAPLADAVAMGAEPFRIVGAMAGVRGLQTRRAVERRVRPHHGRLKGSRVVKPIERKEKRKHGCETNARTSAAPPAGL
jgi:hypothetical protein